MAPLDKGVNAVKKESFCPICGSRCGGDMGIECPNHGIVNPEFSGYESYRPDAPGQQKPDNVFMPKGVPLTAAILDKNELEGHPDDKGGETIDYLKEWKTDDERHFDGNGDLDSDNKILIITEPSLDADDEDFECCEHGDKCPHIVNTWVYLLGDDR
tara:strand:- start:252 stop:722 length:471 start_codon:yes stop_codon:yes gene_type:complete